MRVAVERLSVDRGALRDELAQEVDIRLVSRKPRQERIRFLGMAERRQRALEAGERIVDVRSARTAAAGSAAACGSTYAQNARTWPPS